MNTILHLQRHPNMHQNNGSSIHLLIPPVKYNFCLVLFNKQSWQI